MDLHLKGQLHVRTHGTQGNSPAELLGLSIAKRKFDALKFSCIAATDTQRNENLRENWKRGISASSHVFVFNYGAFAAEKKADENVI